jgi:hypothetical protein
MNKQKCPACGDREVTSGTPNLLNHIRGKAKTEAFEHLIFGRQDIPHVDFLQGNMKKENVGATVYSVRVGGRLHKWVKQEKL